MSDAAPTPEPARTAVAGHIDFTASLDSFQGPLDLLLYLIKENEVDIIEIPVARILDQYLKFMDQATQWDLQLAGEFLVMATTLMEIKSRELLPVQQQTAELEEIIEDPRSELVRQLLEYRRLKDQARELDILQDRWAKYRARGMTDEIPVVAEGEDAEAERALAKEALVDVDLYSLYAAYEKILKATLTTQPRNIVYDGESIEEKIKRIEETLKSKPFARFVELVKDPGNRADIASTFVALLELVRRRAVRLIQQRDFAPFDVKVQDEAEAEALSKQEAAEAEAASAQALDNRAAFEAAQAAQAEGAEKLPWKKKRMPARPKFEGINRPEDIMDIDAEETEIGRKIDAILAIADQVSERFEQSREGRVRDEDAPGTEVPPAPEIPAEEKKPEEAPPSVDAHPKNPESAPPEP
ncbi:MAG TPA: segregation/condensation protein A [Planctomycetota bacterium]|nr:segregation/condensation protein A [Planctomycetota bacterium]